MRARNIKPGFFYNEELGGCSLAAMLLYVGIWCFADRDGRFEWRPPKIKASIFPYDQNVEIESVLGELLDKDFVVKYQVNGYYYGYIPHFLDHQKPHPHEAASKIPSYDNGKPSHDIERFIYFVTTENEGGPIKIGISDDPIKRIKSLQTGNHEKLRLLGIIKAQKTTEKEIHDRFYGNKISGEWYSATPEIKKFIVENSDVDLLNHINVIARLTNGMQCQSDSLILGFSDSIYTQPPVAGIQKPKNIKKNNNGKCLIPEDFEITDDMRKWFADQNFNSISITEATAEFIDYWKACGKQMKDWVATWRNGMRMKEKWSQKDNKNKAVTIYTPREHIPPVHEEP